MIPKDVLREFVQRQRADHRWIKTLSASELDDALAALEPPPQLYPKQRLHQKACFLLGVAYPQFGFWLDMGAGKTLLALELLRYWWDIGRLNKAVILVTSDKAYLTWQRQIERFEIDIPYVFLEGSSEDKWRQWHGLKEGLIIVHYPGLVAMLTRRVKTGRKGKLEIDPSKMGEFCTGVGGLVMDESTKLGNPNSLTHQIGQHLADHAFARYALAGRPFGRDPLMLWPQFDLLDRGATLGDTLGLFREAFFDPQANYAARAKAVSRKARNRAKHLKEYKFNKRMMPELTRIIQNRSITYTTDEFPDLPPLGRTADVIEVNLPEDTEAYYQRLIDEIIAAKGNFRAMENVFHRMRQLSSGFLALRDDETGERIEVEFDENPKLDRLLELTDELPEQRKAVVFYDYTHSGRTIYEQLSAKKVGAIWLWSGTKNPTAELRRFLEKDSCTVAVINNKVGAYSLDGLQEVANYTFFYESPVSVIDREQSERRILRQGQPHHVFQYDLVVRDTVDEKILEFHREGRDLYKELTRHPEKLFVKR